MRQYTLQEKYPVYHMSLPFSETSKTSADEILEYYKKKIEEDDRVVYIATFDHHAHTQGIGGEINPEIKAAMVRVVLVQSTQRITGADKSLATSALLVEPSGSMPS